MSADASADRDLVILEWPYGPADFLEEAIAKTFGPTTLMIETSGTLAGTARIKVSGSAHCRLFDASGIVIRDTRAERIASERRASEGPARHAGDELLGRMVRSYGAAVRDPEDEFVACTRSPRRYGRPSGQAVCPSRMVD